MVFIPINERPPSAYRSFDSLYGEDSFTHLTPEWLHHQEFADEFDGSQLAATIMLRVDERPNLTPYRESENSPNDSNLKEFQERAHPYSCIKACCGDDCITVSDCSAYMPTLIASCEVIHGVTISEADLGNSHSIGAYTQGFILMPLSPVSGFTSINEYIGHDAVPWTFDLPDMKRYSGIKKQSDEFVDFSDKYIYVAQTSDWVDPDWITSDFHQLGKLVIMATLDFRSGAAHPFVFKAEGGCGGFPPWNNIRTAESSFYHYRRGKESSAIILALQESTRIRSGSLEPKDSEYLQLIHQSQNIQLWTSILYQFREFKKQGLSTFQIRDHLNQLLAKEKIPDQVRELGVEVYPRTTLVGMMIAQMRNFGLIMTELDVMNHYAKCEKFKNLTGDKPLGPLLAEEEERLRKNRKKGNRLVLELTEILSPDYGDLKVEREFALRNRTQILSEYYKSHPGHFLSSFIYSDAVRVFKTSDIVEATDSNERRLLIESLGLPTFPKKDFFFIPQSDSMLLTFHKAVDFAKNLNLNELNDNTVELPFIGAADPLVLRETIRVYNEYKSIERHPTDYVMVLVTEDQFLVWAVAQYMKRKFNVCVLYISGKWMYDWISRDPAKERQFLSNRNWRQRVPRFESLKVTCFQKTRALTELDCEQVVRLAHLEKSPNYISVSFIFDGPNVRRRLGLISRSGPTQTISHGHSWLRRDYLASSYGIPASIAFQPEKTYWEFLKKPSRPVDLVYRRNDAIKLMAAPLRQPEG